MPSETMKKLMHEADEMLLKSIFEGIEELPLEQLLKLQKSVDSRVAVMQKTAGGNS